MKIGDALVVEGLGLRRAGGDGLVDDAGAAAQGHGALQDLAGHPADGSSARGMGIVLGQEMDRTTSQDQNDQNRTSHGTPSARTVRLQA